MPGPGRRQATIRLSCFRSLMSAPREDMSALLNESSVFAHARRRGVVPPQINDEVEVMVVSPLDSEGDLIVSLSQAHDSGDWARAEQLLESGEVFEGSGTAANRGRT